jgi:Spermine/spermidine synthase domain
MVSNSLLAFLLASLFILSLSVLLFELTLTRMFSIILWYNYAFMAISVAFFGLGIGALLVHLVKNKMKREDLPKKIIQSTIAFAVSLPIFLFVIGHLIPPSISFIYLFFLASSIPFLFAGLSMALIYLAMPSQITKLYFIDLAGASAATLILDPVIRGLGAESVLLLIGVFGTFPPIIAYASLLYSRKPKATSDRFITEKKPASFGIVVLCVSAVLLAANLHSNILAIQPGDSKGLRYLLANPAGYTDASTKWNSFSRIDVVKHTNDISKTGFRDLASILIDADALTPILKWNGSISDRQWLKGYMDYMPYEMSKMTNSSTLVIGSGGGEDILVALSAGSKNVTAVELNPLIVSAVKQYGGSSAGNLYNRKDVQLSIDDGRRFISSTNTKYDTIVIKLVDSWAAQLAGGYALSENYLYTVEAFRQYLSHLNGANGKLVMVRWSTELPRLIPLAVEALREYEKGTSNQQDISKQILVVEDSPGLTFGPNPQRTFYPVLLVIKNSPFTASELALIKERVNKSDAKVIAMPGGYVQPPYDRLLLGGGNNSNNSNNNNNNNLQQQPQQALQVSYDPQRLGFELRPPTDDSPFFFATQLVPSQMVLLIETVLGVSAVLGLLLVYYSKVNKIRLTSSSRFHIVFAMFIGLGFIFLEITFIQRFLLLLGTPIMALTVILFSILLSTGIGAYLSGKLFHKNPYKAIMISIPPLAGIVLAYYVFLQGIIESGIVWQLPERIALAFVLLSPTGFLMGFQFPSITRMASSSSASSRLKQELHGSEGSGGGSSSGSGDEDITLLWGVNVIASVVGTVLTATSSMIIGFNGNLLIGVGLYLGALGSAVAAQKISQKMGRKVIVK